MPAVILAKKTDRLHVSLEPARFEEALDWLWERTPMVADEYYALSQRARDRAFTISNSADVDMVASVLRDIQRALLSGDSVEGFTKRVQGKLESAWGGTVANPGHRIETIYRTNIQSAFSRGRQAQLDQPMVKKLRPLREFDAVSDRRTSAICEECNGTVVDADDPWLDTHTPPLHHQCRSKIRAHRASQRRLSPTKPAVLPSGGFGGRPESPKDVLEPLTLDVTKLDPELAAKALQKEQKRKEAKPKPVTERKPKGPEGPGLRNGKPILTKVDAPVVENPERFKTATKNEQEIPSFLPHEQIDWGDISAEQRASANKLRESSKWTEEDVNAFTGQTRYEYGKNDNWRALHAQGKASMDACSQESRDAAFAFSDGFDSTIRHLNTGASFEDVVAQRAAAVKESVEEATEHVREAMLHREHLERMYYEAEDALFKTSYRGIHSLPDEVLDKFLAKDIFDMQGKHSSSSAMFACAQNFIENGLTGRKRGDDIKHSVILRLHRKSKAPFIRSVSSFAGEEEILIHGNTRWRIISRHRLPTPSTFGAPLDEASQTWMIEAEEVID